MLRLSLFIFIIIILTSCYNENKVTREEPEPFLTEVQLIEVITDMQLAEAVLSYDKTKKSTLKGGLKDSVYQLIFNKYGLTIEQLKDNLDYYNQNPKNMERLFEDVLSNLSKLQSEIQIEALSNDSLAKLDDLPTKDSLIRNDTLTFNDTLVLIDTLIQSESFPGVNSFSFNNQK